jgi:hypothetical protein
MAKKFLCDVIKDLEMESLSWLTWYTLGEIIRILEWETNLCSS